MTQVHWVVQANQGNPVEVEAIVRAIDEDGHVAHLVPLQKGLGMPDIPELNESAPIVCHGAGFVTRAWEHPLLRRGLFFDPARFRWSIFRHSWPEAMLCPDGVTLPWAAAVELLRSRGKPAFVRPDEDSKLFDGGLCTADSLLTTGRNAIDVVVALPVEIEAEWRFFIVNGEVAGCSEYRRWERPSTEGAVPQRAIAFAAGAAAHWGPAAVYCLDLAAEAGTGRIGIVEANCFNAARFYSANVAQVLRAVNAHVLSTAR